MARVRSRLNGKLREELTEAEHQRSEEHLVSSDRGVSLVRRMPRQQLEAPAQGRPVGVAFHEDASPVRLEAGNRLVEG